MRDRDGDEQEEAFWEGFAGDDLAIPIQLLDGNGDPVKIGLGDGMTDIVGEFTTANLTDYQTKYSAAAGVTLIDSTTGRCQVNVPAASSALLATNRVKKQRFTVYTVINGKQTTWSGRILLKPRPVPAAC